MVHKTSGDFLAKMSGKRLASRREGEYNTRRDGRCARPLRPGRAEAGPLAPHVAKKINRVRLRALSAASTGSCAADEGEVFPRCAACIPLLHGPGRGPRYARGPA